MDLLYSQGNPNQQKAGEELSAIMNRQKASGKSIKIVAKLTEDNFAELHPENLKDLKSGNYVWHMNKKFQGFYAALCLDENLDHIRMVLATQEVLEKIIGEDTLKRLESNYDIRTSQ